jgi:hypothetical protein
MFHPHKEILMKNSRPGRRRFWRLPGQAQFQFRIHWQLIRNWNYRFPHGNLNNGPADAVAAKRRKSAENLVFG